MDRVVYKKREAGKGKAEPGTWWNAGGKEIGLCCHECGKWATLDHTVSENGDVNPSLVCPYDPCTMHVWGTLEGWTPSVD